VAEGARISPPCARRSMRIWASDALITSTAPWCRACSSRTWIR
jgi:hypothetical protein